MGDRLGPILLVIAVGAALGAGAFLFLREEVAESTSAATTTTTSGATTTSQPTTTIVVDPTSTTTEPDPVRAPGTMPGWTVGQPWGSTPGLTMFRGSPTRTFYGSGPISSTPTMLWRYPESPMCSESTVGGETTVWCGTGWTGQPAVYERPDGVTEVVFGAYDRAVHFVDAETGTDLRRPFPTGDIIKGSVTIDPDGFPLLYFGSRDNKLRIVALDRDDPELLWSLDANEVQGIWNNDWDGNPVVVDDILYEGGENGWFFAYRLNRAIGSDGLVVVEPERIIAMPGYDDLLVSRSGPNVSIESSVTVYEDRVYFANSGGRVVGVDVSAIDGGEAPIVFDYYAGGDIDATPVVDQDGALYLAIEYEPSQMGATERERATEVGQLVKLDPYAEGDPRVWGIDLRSGSEDAGIWATPALHDGFLYVGTQAGDLLAVDTAEGRIAWSDRIGWHAWSSPVVVNDTLVVATCSGEIRGYSLGNPRFPQPLWTIADMGGTCLESTPAIWAGTIYVGARDGFVRAFR